MATKVMKIADCPDCQGRGYVPVTGDGFAYAKHCRQCDGKGFIFVAATNYQIASCLSQDEMAKFLVYAGSFTEEAIVAWLGKEASLEEWNSMGIDSVSRW